MALGIMKNPCAIALGTLAIFCSQAGAAPGKCFELICITEGNDFPDCPMPPVNLSANLPKGFAIKEIDGYMRIAPIGNIHEGSCKRVKRLPFMVSLDTSDMGGTLNITGTFTASGILRYEMSEGALLEFTPSLSTFKGAGIFFREKFERLNLDEAQPSPSITPPRSLHHNSCWQAKATIRATDFSVRVGDSSLAGTYVRKLRISDVHDFRACK